MPRATSRAIEPVGITAMGARPSSPRRMTEPLPYCLSICARASSSALSLSGAAGMEVHLVGLSPPGLCSVLQLSGPTLAAGSDNSRRDARSVDRWTRCGQHHRRTPVRGRHRHTLALGFSPARVRTRAYPPRSASFAGDVEGVADLSPDLLGRDSCRQRLVDGAA